MCVIIIKDHSKKIDLDVLRNCANLNPDGLGIVWLEDYRIEKCNSDDYKKLDTNKPFIAHFRYATVGKICLDNNHPFHIKNGSYLMQNGTNESLSFTKQVDTKLLANILAKCNPKTWIDILELTESRYCIIDVKNKTYDIANYHLFTENEQTLYSKANVLNTYEYLAVYGTLKKGYGNYYNYLTDSKFIGSGVTSKKYPLVIDGLPYMLNKPHSGHNVEVDLFKVSKEVLDDIDVLEGHPTWYKREKTKVIVNGMTFNAWIYFNPTTKDNGNYHKTYEQKPIYSFNDFDECCPQCGGNDVDLDINADEYFCNFCVNYF